MSHVVCFGEIMLRFSPPWQERFFQSSEMKATFGGSEANVAVSLSHFGVRSEYVTRVPENPLGDAALRSLRAEGVDVDHCVRGPERLGIYFVESGTDIRPLRVVYDRDDSAMSRLAPDELDWGEILRGAAWFHVSGITPALGEGPRASTERAMETARRLGVTVSIDLNYRAALWTGREPGEVIRPFARMADLLIANPTAIRQMLGVGCGSDGVGEEDAETLAGEVHAAFGCPRVAITHREAISASEHRWQATLVDVPSRAVWPSRPYQVQLVDRVGGGDSFVAALIFALSNGRDGGAAVEFATAASALKLTIAGDFNRVSVTEVERVIEASAQG